MTISPERLISELRRRKVFRVAGAYLVGVFVVLQVGDIVIEPLGLPAWTMAALIWAAALGLPMSLAFAWVFDVTAEGIKRTEAAPADGPVPAATTSPRALGYVGVGILVGLVGFGGYAYFGEIVHDESAAIRSVAVLPFVNISGDADNEYFSDGITEELLNVLAEVPGLRVPARTSSFQFKGENVDVRDVGRRLSVQAVLEGSVRKARGQVRITAQLVNAASGYQIWSSSYERELSDIFAVQDEIAREIVGALRLKLAGGGAAQPASATVPSVEAHDSYLLGRYHFHRRGAESLREAERHFRAAIAADSTYADAYAGLALTYSVLPLFDPAGTPVERAVAEGRAAGWKALSLDPAQADAHAALAQIAQNFEWDLETAERHYTRALELAPNNALARMWRVELLVIRGRPEAPAEMERALALDPLSPIANSLAAFAHLFVSRDFARAAHFWERVAELDPAFPLLLEHAPLAYVALADPDAARAVLLRLAKTAADSQAFAAWAGAAAAVRSGGAIDDVARKAALEAATRYGRLASTGDVGTAILTGPIDPDSALDLLLPHVNDPRHRHSMTWIGRF
jgi:TolB-like protein/Tfp pilus assembly protein PilF